MNFEDFSPFLMIPLFLLLILETIFSLAWVKFYYRNGIPLVKRSYRIPLMFDLTPHVNTLENALKRGVFRPAITIKPFGSNEFAFRNRFTSRNQVNGIIRVESSNGRITITGHIYWAFLIMLVFGIYVSFAIGNGLPFFGFLFIGGLGLFFQWLMTNSIINIMYDTMQKEGLLLDDPFTHD
ncbi:MAG: hypothetical protein KC419_24020 [Anaerolineales bacterium]|nr:hypothetical protein [Anaerolineales bacterium]